MATVWKDFSREKPKEGQNCIIVNKWWRGDIMIGRYDYMSDTFNSNIKANHRGITVSPITHWMECPTYEFSDDEKREWQERYQKYKSINAQ